MSGAAHGPRRRKGDKAGGGGEGRAPGEAGAGGSGKVRVSPGEGGRQRRAAVSARPRANGARPSAPWHAVALAAYAVLAAAWTTRPDDGSLIAYVGRVLADGRPVPPSYAYGGLIEAAAPTVRVSELLVARVAHDPRGDLHVGVFGAWHQVPEAARGPLARCLRVLHWATNARYIAQGLAGTYAPLLWRGAVRGTSPLVAATLIALALGHLAHRLPRIAKRALVRAAGGSGPPAGPSLRRAFLSAPLAALSHPALAHALLNAAFLGLAGLAVETRAGPRVAAGVAALAAPAFLLASPSRERGAEAEEGIDEGERALRRGQAAGPPPPSPSPSPAKPRSHRRRPPTPRLTAGGADGAVLALLLLLLTWQASDAFRAREEGGALWELGLAEGSPRAGAVARASHALLANVFPSHAGSTNLWYGVRWEGGGKGGRLDPSDAFIRGEDGGGDGDGLPGIPAGGCDPSAGPCPQQRASAALPVLAAAAALAGGGAADGAASALLSATASEHSLSDLFLSPVCLSAWYCALGSILARGKARARARPGGRRSAAVRAAGPGGCPPSPSLLARVRAAARTLASRWALASFLTLSALPLAPLLAIRFARRHFRDILALWAAWALSSVDVVLAIAADTPAVRLAPAAIRAGRTLTFSLALLALCLQASRARRVLVLHGM